MTNFYKFEQDMRERSLDLAMTTTDGPGCSNTSDTTLQGRVVRVPGDGKALSDAVWMPTLLRYGCGRWRPQISFWRRQPSRRSAAKVTPTIYPLTGICPHFDVDQ